MIQILYYKHYYFLVYILLKLNMFDFSENENDNYLGTEEGACAYYHRPRSKMDQFGEIHRLAVVTRVAGPPTKPNHAQFWYKGSSLIMKPKGSGAAVKSP
jgi:hypothetical protein